jgi:hypothetical protein
MRRLSRGLGVEAARWYGAVGLLGVVEGVFMVWERMQWGLNGGVWVWLWNGMGHATSS